MPSTNRRAVVLGDEQLQEGQWVAHLARARIVGRLLISVLGHV